MILAQRTHNTKACECHVLDPTDVRSYEFDC